MESSVNLQGLVNKYIDQAENQDVLNILEQTFFKYGLIGEEVFMGDEGIKEKLKYSIFKKGNAIKEADIGASFYDTLKELSLKYRNHRRNLRWKFSILPIIAMLLLWASLLNNNIIIIIFLIFFVMTCYWLFVEYKKLNSREAVIQQLLILKAQLELISLMSEEESKKIAYNRVFSFMQITAHSNPVTIINNFDKIDSQINTSKQDGDIILKGKTL